MPKIPIIDSHVHFWNPADVAVPWLTGAASLNRPFLPVDLADARGPVDVEAIVFVECDVAEKDALAEVAWVTRLAEREPRIQAIVAHAPLENGVRVVRHLEQLSAFSVVRGIRRLIQAEADPEFCLRPDFVAGVRLLPRFGWSFDACIVHSQMKSLIRLADLCPEVEFVLDHIGKPAVRDAGLHPWREDLFDLARRDNVVCKLSGVATEADHANWTPAQLEPFIEATLAAFGPKRVMFGGDWPVSTLAIAYQEWVATVERSIRGFSEDERRQIWSETARSFYKMGALA